MNPWKQMPLIPAVTSQPPEAEDRSSLWARVHAVRNSCARQAVHFSWTSPPGSLLSSFPWDIGQLPIKGLYSSLTSCWSRKDITTLKSRHLQEPLVLIIMHLRSVTLPTNLPSSNFEYVKVASGFSRGTPVSATCTHYHVSEPCSYQ